MKLSIIYYSLTGNVRYFVETYFGDTRPIYSIEDDIELPDKYVLFTPTYHFGEVPSAVQEWLTDNSEAMIGVVASGNRNWGKNFGKAGDIISNTYGVPLIAKFELRGNDEVAYEIKTKINEISEVN